MTLLLALLFTLLGLPATVAAALTCDTQAPGVVIVRCPPYNAVQDGVTDDTAAVNAALASLGTGGGRIILGPIKTGNLTFAGTPIAPFTFEITGPWTLTEPIVFPNNTALLGQACARPGLNCKAQFKTPPSARVLCAAGSAACLTLAGNNYVRDLEVTGSAGPVCRVTGAGVTLENVSCGTSSGTGVEVGLWIDQSVQWTTVLGGFYSTSNTGLASIRMTSASVVRISRATVAGQRLLIDVAPGGYAAGNIHLEHVLAESLGTNPTLTLDSTNGAIVDVELDDVQYADSTPTSFISVVGSGVRGLTLRGHPNGPIFNPGAVVAGLYIDGQASYSSGAPSNNLYSWGHPPLEYTAVGGGYVDGQTVTGFGPMSPSLIPFPPELVPTDPTAWAAAPGTATVTPTTGPDGLPTTAGQFSGSMAVRTIYTKSNITLSLGDWIIAGVWVRNDGAASNITSNVSLGTGHLFDTSFVGAIKHTIRLHSTRPVQLRGPNAPWVPITVAGKIGTLGTNPSTISLVLGVNGPTGTTSYYMPWMIYVPVSAGVSDAEVIRWKRSLMVVPAKAKPGYVATYPHLGQYVGGKHITYATGPPTTGTWAVGDLVYNTTPEAGGFLGWVCTTAGAPGTWKSWGAISP